MTGDGGETLTPIVFTDEVVADLTRRFRSKPSSYRSGLYHVATSHERSGLRAWVEGVVGRVPEPGRSKLVPRLLADEHLLNTLNELAVAAILQLSGLVVLYEHDLDGVTPDWFVPGTADDPPVIVEVWTKNYEQRAVGRRRQWQALRDRVGKIPVGVLLNVLPRSRQGPPSTPMAKDLVRDLRVWLEQELPEAGMQIVLPLGASSDRNSGYRFRLAGVVPDATHALLTLPGEGGTYTTIGLIAQVESKIARYAQVAISAGAAFVVVVAADPGTPISRDLLRSVVEGRQSLEVSIDPHVHGQIADVTLPMNAVDVPRRFHEAVSAVGWVDLRLSGTAAEPPTIDLQLFANPARVVDPPSLGEY